MERIAWLSAGDPQKAFHQLMHHYNEESLLQCYYELDGKKAVGADGVTKSDYGEQLTTNTQDLVERMKRMDELDASIDPSWLFGTRHRELLYFKTHRQSQACIARRRNCHPSKTKATPQIQQRKKPKQNKKFADIIYDQELFEELRVLRKQLDSDANVPPFIIFSDASLIDMSVKLPSNDQEFLDINGVGQSKLKNYGEPFLAVIKHWTRQT